MHAQCVHNARVFAALSHGRGAKEQPHLPPTHCSFFVTISASLDCGRNLSLAV